MFMAAKTETIELIPLQIFGLKMMIVLQFIALCIYHFLRSLLPKGFGPAGALGWAITGVVELLKYHKEFSEADIFLFAVTASVGFLILIGHIFKLPKEGYFFGALYQLRHFLLTVCAPAGATYFTLTWLGLVLIAFDAALFTSPPILALLAISGIIASASVYLIYFGDQKKGVANSLHCFISRVLGSGGAVHWFLMFLAFTGVSIPALVTIILPAVIMLCAAVVWYLEHTHEDPNKPSAATAVTKPCLTCFYGQGKGRVQTEDTKALLKESVKSHQAGSGAFQ
jgi:hypothetical protein